MAIFAQTSYSKRVTRFAGVLLAATCWAGVEALEGTRDPRVQNGSTMKIRIEVAGSVITATLDDNETSRDFVTLLPMTLPLEDYASTEKITYLPKRLSTQGAPSGFTPAAGDVTYYAPWGNLAIFHKDFSHSKGLIKLGRIDSGLERLRRAGTLVATITLVSE